jgi:SH3/ankyrin repeat-containing protein
MVHHLEHLLFYGADINAQNASGNTPLHVCAVNNQVPKVRLAHRAPSHSHLPLRVE